MAGSSASVARAADSVYWTDFGSSAGEVRVGPLAGGTASTLFTDPRIGSEGIGLDPAAGRLYWTNNFATTVRGANLDGTGSATDLFTIAGAALYGLAIDPGAGQLYWANNPTKIESGAATGGTYMDLFTDGGAVQGVAVDPAAGKVYWTNNSTSASPTSGTIQVGPIAGSASAADHALFTGQHFPTGVAIDAVGGKIYWATADAIMVGNLDGSGSPSPLFTEAGVVGLAIDHAAGKIYWAIQSTGKIRVGNLTGGGASDLFTGESLPDYLALLRAPVGAGSPQVSGGTQVGQQLSCTRGSWSSDLVGAFLFRAPRSFAYQWSFNGADIGGATASSYTTQDGGSYSCRVIASNQAGSTAQTSGPFTVTGAGTPPPTTPPPTTATGRPPRLTGVSQSHVRWRRGTRLPTFARTPRVPVGTTFSFSLNEPARVTFTFRQQLPGRSVKSRCVAPSKRNRRKHPCGRTVTAGTVAFTGHSGPNKVFFQGRISPRKALTPGSYTLIITATNSSRQSSSPGALRFVIVK